MITAVNRSSHSISTPLTTTMFSKISHTIFTLILLLLTSQRLSANLSFQQVKERASSAYQDNCRAAWRQCSAQPLFPHQAVDFDRSLRGRQSAVTDRGRRATDLIRDLVRSAKEKAIYLSDHTGTLLKDIGQNAQWNEFTLDCWILPEGGQHNPAIILDAEDVCSSFEDKGWTLGIESTENGGERNGNIFFRLQTQSNKKSSTLQSPMRYEPRRWTHIMVTYNGHSTKLFINGAQVAVDHSQKGELFKPNNPESCITLQIGGHNGNSYRGAVAKVSVRSFAMPPEDAQDAMFEPKEDNVLFFEGFDSLDGWEWIGNSPQSGQNPQITLADIPSRRYNLRLRPPQCGFTVCDVPDIVKSYESNHHLKQQKTLGYRIVNVRDYDGSNPTVSSKQIKRQEEILRQAFSPYNISWESHIHNVYNSTLRRRTVIFGCSPLAVGNGECNPECQFAITNNDGGDCDAKRSQCDSEKKGNGRCDDECNVFYHQWDEGDCCDPEVTDTSVTCVDPFSTERGYMDLQEYKEILQLKSDKYINIFFASWNNKEIVGLATFPWEKVVFGVHVFVRFHVRWSSRQSRRLRSGWQNGHTGP